MNVKPVATMSDSGSDATAALDDAIGGLDGLRAEITAALEGRRAAIERALHIYIQEALSTSLGGDSNYHASVSAAVAALLDYCLAAIAPDGADWPGPASVKTAVHQGAISPASRKAFSSAQGKTHAARPLLAAALEDEALGASLVDFLAPLRSRPDGGAALLRTLRAYLDAECNGSSAASALKVRRQTVGNRLRLVEHLLDRPLRSCLAELDVALRLVDLSADDGQMLD
jgi:hypothetical protein